MKKKIWQIEAKKAPLDGKWVNTCLSENNEVEVANYEIITKWILWHRHTTTFYIHNFYTLVFHICVLFMFIFWFAPDISISWQDSCASSTFLALHRRIAILTKMSCTVTHCAQLHCCTDAVCSVQYAVCSCSVHSVYSAQLHTVLSPIILSPPKLSNSKYPRSPRARFPKQIFQLLPHRRNRNRCQNGQNRFIIPRKVFRIFSLIKLNLILFCLSWTVNSFTDSDCPNGNVRTQAYPAQIFPK